MCAVTPPAAGLCCVFTVDDKIVTAFVIGQ